MIGVFLAWLAAAAPAAAAPAAGVHPAEVEERLGRLVGDWAIQGLARTDFRQKCAWYGARAFVLCTFEDKRSGTTGQAAFGYSPVDKRFTYSLMDSTGRSLRQLGFPHGAYGLVFTDERLDAKGPTRVQTTFVVEDDGLRFTDYRSVAGGTWQQAENFVLVPVRQAPPARRRRR
jgi:hypothetical protein